ncbi:MAG: diacylglycerol kinase [Streptosporangiales bacterium]|nr:diacylglycerol kinase [Streptosporangiales bacterium]
MASLRTAVVVNPTKCDAEQLRKDVHALLTDAGWPPPAWYETTADSPGADQATQAVRAGARIVFACGGDGTVRSCVDALAGSQAALAVLPAGTGNLLAGNLGLPTDVPAAVDVALHGNRRRIDVGRVDGLRFAVAAGMGFDADLLHDAPAALKRSVGWLAYVVSALRHLGGPSLTVDIALDDGPPRRHRVRTVLVANVSELRGGLSVAPEASDHDGRFDVVVVAPRRPVDWLGVVYKTLRRQPHDQVLRRTAAAVDVHVVKTVANRQLDGDPIEPSDRLTVRMEPEALEVCVP